MNRFYRVALWGMVWCILLISTALASHVGNNNYYDGTLPTVSDPYGNYYRTPNLILGPVATPPPIAWTPNLILGPVEDKNNGTPELGDSSVSVPVLVGISCAALVGALIAHRKVKKTAR